MRRIANIILLFSSSIVSFNLSAQSIQTLPKSKIEMLEPSGKAVKFKEPQTFNIVKLINTNGVFTGYIAELDGNQYSIDQSCVNDNSVLQEANAIRRDLIQNAKKLNNRKTELVSKEREVIDSIKIVLKDSSRIYSRMADTLKSNGYDRIQNKYKAKKIPSMLSIK